MIILPSNFHVAYRYHKKDDFSLQTLKSVNDVDIICSRINC
jgi:hypothetical protein